MSYSSIVDNLTLTIDAVEPKTFNLIDLLPALPTVVMGIVTIVAVHLLTRKREQEKYIHELHAQISEMTDKVCSVACEAWEDGASQSRAAKVQQTLWRLQQIAQTVERMRILTAGNKLVFGKWFFPFRRPEIEMDDELSQFWETITADPFLAKTRGKSLKNVPVCEAAKGIFLNTLDRKFSAWLNPM